MRYSLYLLLVLAFNILPVSTKKLSKSIDTILDQYPHIHVGCQISSLEKDKRIIYSRNADHLFIPASNTKIFTAILALEYLGADYLFDTDIYIDGYISKQILHGNIYIKASGNPSLTNKSLEQLIKMLCKKIGIHKITGNCYIDSTLFDSEVYPPGSFLDNIGYSWNSPIHALIIDHKPAILSKDFTYNSLSKADEYIFIDNVVVKLFEKYKIVFNGIVENKTVPDDAQIILQHQSPPLSKLLTTMLKESDNLYADCIFKKIASCNHLTPATWTNASNVLYNFLEDILQVSSRECVIKDGSGRSRYNLISPQHIVKLLTFAYKQPYYAIFLDNFPINGIDGTLKERLIEIYPCIKAKTGTLSGVSTFSGYIEFPTETIAFSILINGYVSENIMNPPYKKEIEDAICAQIVKFYSTC